MAIRRANPLASRPLLTCPTWQAFASWVHVARRNTEGHVIGAIAGPIGRTKQFRPGLHHWRVRDCCHRRGKRKGTQHDWSSARIRSFSAKGRAPPKECPPMTNVKQRRRRFVHREVIHTFDRSATDRRSRDRDRDFHADQPCWKTQARPPIPKLVGAFSSGVLLSLLPDTHTAAGSD